MAKSLKNLIRPTLLWAREITERLKRLEDIVAFLGAATFIFRSGVQVGDPGVARFYLDNTVKALSTSASISNITEGGVDVDEVYDGVDPGDQMIISQENDPGRNLHTTVSSVTDNGTWHEFDYTVDAANGGEFQNNRSCSVTIIRN